MHYFCTELVIRLSQIPNFQVRTAGAISSTKWRVMSGDYFKPFGNDQSCEYEDIRKIWCKAKPFRATHACHTRLPTSAIYPDQPKWDFSRDGTREVPNTNKVLFNSRTYSMIFLLQTNKVKPASLERSGRLEISDNPKPSLRLKD